MDEAPARGLAPTPLIAGRYRRERLLGRGGMGEVHAAIDLRGGRPVAIKLMLGHRLDNLDARARFEREARVGARIDGAHLVLVHDAGVDADTGTPYIVMELLVGEDLEQRLERLGPRPADEVVSHLGQVALALTRLAAARIVHRDLKPSNLFLHQPDAEPPRVKVLDLGIAKELAETGSQSTAVAGTPVYMAPEQITGAALSAATDRHALGLIAFTLLVGAPYWAKVDGEEAIALAVKMKDGTRTPASTRARELGATLPAAFDAWFARATARRPGRRFQSAIAAVRALAAALAVEAPAWLPADPEPADAADGPIDDGDDATPLPSSGTVTSPPRRVAAGATVPARTGRATIPARTVLATAIGIGGLGGLALVAARAWPGAAATAAPLAAADSVLACPVLEVDGDVARSGWLGAAAATLACERARVILGGSPARTLVPAELLELPAEPGDAFPVDPYGATDARPRSLAAAQRRGAAYLDGAVHRRGAQFEVELVLRRPDGGAIARHRGTGDALEQAVRAAMRPLVDAGAVPTALVVDPVVADYSQAWDVATMLDYLDLNLAFKNNAGQIEEMCADVTRRLRGATERAQFAAWECASTTGATLPTIALTGAADTPGAITTRARVDHMVNRHDPPATVARLAQLHDAARWPWARSAIAATLSCMVQADVDLGTRWAQRAVQHAAKNPTGEYCAPWDQLIAIDARRSSVTRATQAWEPWHPYAWSFDPDAAHRPTYAERAYTLSPLDADVARRYADVLIDAARHEDARAVAVRLESGGNPVQVLEGERIQLRIASSTARFGEALTRARTLMSVQPGDAGWVLTQRLAFAADAVALAVILGRAHEVADAVVAAHVMAASPPVDDLVGDQTEWLPTICAYASPAVARPCFARLDLLLAARSAAAMRSSAAYIAGARRYAEGDLRGAARAWRPLVAEHAYGALAEAMVVAFHADGDDRVVADIAAHARLSFNGASMATAQAALALAASGRGDRAVPAALAAQVIAAWADADEEPPVLAALRRIAP